MAIPNVAGQLEETIGTANMDSLSMPIAQVLTDMKTYATEKPAYAIISAVALAALGFFITATARFMLPIPVVMPLVASTLDLIIGGATLFMFQCATDQLRKA